MAYFSEYPNFEAYTAPVEMPYIPDIVVTPMDPINPGNQPFAFMQPQSFLIDLWDILLQNERECLKQIHECLKTFGRSPLHRHDVEYIRERSQTHCRDIYNIVLDNTYPGPRAEIDERLTGSSLLNLATLGAFGGQPSSSRREAQSGYQLEPPRELLHRRRSFQTLRDMWDKYVPRRYGLGL